MIAKSKVRIYFSAYMYVCVTPDTEKGLMQATWYVVHCQTFIIFQSLISKPPLRNSEDLKQFLGVTDGEQISFIKPSVAQMMSQSVHVPRVDKVINLALNN